MVARQHTFNERMTAEEKALDQARGLADRLDSRFGAIETVLLTLAHSVSARPADSLRNDRLLRDVAAELPSDFAHFAVTTLSGVGIGTSDTLPGGRRRAIVVPSRARDTLLDFVIQGPTPLYGSEGPPATAVSYEDTALKVRVSGLVTVASQQRELSRNTLTRAAIATIIDRRGTVILRSSDPEKWLGKNVADSSLFAASTGKAAGTAAIRDLDGQPVFSGFVTTRHVPWVVHVGSPQGLAFAKQRTDFWRAVLVGGIALLAAVILAWTQATRIIMPIRRVVRDAVLLAKGELSHRSAPSASGGEIGILSDTLNTMAEALQSARMPSGEARCASAPSSRTWTTSSSS